jgi:hypothetical protein
MSGVIPTAGLIAQQHQPSAAAHVVILAGVALAALVVVGVNRARHRRARPDEHSRSHDPSKDSTRSKEQA